MKSDYNFPEKELTWEIIGAFYTMYNALGHGFLESVYQRAMEHELKKRGFRVDREYLSEVYYDGVVVGHFRSDLIVELKVVLETKASERIPEAERKKMVHYLKCTNLTVGLVLHFGPKAEVHRFVSTDRQSLTSPTYGSAPSASNLRNLRSRFSPPATTFLPPRPNHSPDVPPTKNTGVN
jgi:GxxExxY protein